MLIGLHKHKESGYIMDTWLSSLMKQILIQMSPAIRDTLVKFVDQLEADAKGTKNPWDDIGVGLLKFVLLIK